MDGQSPIINEEVLDFCCKVLERGIQQGLDEEQSCKERYGGP
jgi:hypothetical protein